jgi:hypothetical protein
MRNRAKCKLCKNVIESFTLMDYVTCSCGEITIEGGNQKFLVYCRDFANFLRIDDQDNEVEVTVKQASEALQQPREESKPLSREQLIEEFSCLLENLNSLPPNAAHTPVTHSDLSSALSLVLTILRCD